MEKDSLVFGKNKYRIVILPGVERIPLHTYRKLEEFVRGGGILIATRRIPQLAPGFKATEAETNEVMELSRRLFKDTGARAHFVADEGNQLANTLTTALRPDVSFTPAEPDIGFVHRRTTDAEIYFLANTSNVRKSVKATFRQQGLQAEWWDPFSGNVAAAKIDAATEKGTTIALDLEPYASRVLVFTRRMLPLRPNDSLEHVKAD